jgi:two-component system, LytTR family, response regulator
MQALVTLPERLPPLSVIRPLLPAGLLLPFPQGKCFVPIEEILVLSSERNYTRFHFCDGSTLIYSRTLGKILTRLPAHAFTRIHRSHAVNRLHIRTISCCCAELVDGSAWAVSRRRGRRQSKG